MHMELLDIIRDIAIPLIIGILSLMTPVLLEALSRIDNKYNSVVLVKAFKQEPIFRLFVIALIASIISIVLWCLNLPRIIDVPVMNNFIDNSASYLLLGATIILVISALEVIWLLTIYYTPGSLLERFVKKYSRVQDKEFYFNCISKIFNYSLVVPDDEITRASWNFIQKEVIKYSKSGNEYPSYVYNAIYEADDLLCKRENNTLISFQNTAFFPLLLRCSDKISDRLYDFLWSSIRQFLFYDKTTYIYNYWKEAHSYYLGSFSFQHHGVENNVNLEQNALRFREFHYALGGLLIKQQRYDLLVKLFTYTNTYPSPTYVLVPERMSLLIKDYIYISRDEIKDAFHWERCYPYPEVDGISANNTIQGYIMRFFAVLFLRQYTIPQYLVIDAPLEMPAVPKTMYEKQYVAEQLSILQKFVGEYRTNRDLMLSLGFEELCDDRWFEEHGKVKPEELLSDYCSGVIMAKNLQEISQSPDPRIIKEFNDKSVDIIVRAYEYCMKFMSPVKCVDVEYKATTIRNKHCILDKAAFCADQGITYVNSLEITAQYVANDIKYFSLNTFLMMRSKKLKLRLTDAFELISRWHSVHCELKVFIVGVNMEYLKQNLTNLKEAHGQWLYDSVEIIPLSGNGIIEQKILLIEKSDLPVLTYVDMPKSTVSKFDLVEVDAERKIYTSVLSLYEPKYEEIKKDIAQDGTSIDELNKKVLACVDVCPHFNYKPDATVVMIDIFDEFTSKGNPQNLEDVKDPWK